MSEPELFRALNTYYTLKTEYEDNVNKMKKKIIDNKTLSWKEKHKEFRKMKPKCITCSRPVGTIFSIRFQKEGGARLAGFRLAKAMCGDRTNPCPLNIELNLGNIINIEDELHETESNIREIRNEIIKDKNDTIFGYVSTPDALDKFSKVQEKLTDATTSYEVILNTYMTIVDNKVTKEKIRKLLLETYGDIKLIKEYVDKYKKAQNLDFINDLVTLYTTQLTPKLTELRQLTYPYCAVENYDNECVLIQKRIQTEQMELDMADKPMGIIHLDLGNTIQPQQRQQQRQRRRNEEEEDEAMFLVE